MHNFYSYMRAPKSFSQYYLHGIIFNLSFFSSSRKENNVLLVILKSNESVVRVAKDEITETYATCRYLVTSN